MRLFILLCPSYLKHDHRKCVHSAAVVSRLKYLGHFCACLCRSRAVRARVLCLYVNILTCRSSLCLRRSQQQRRISRSHCNLCLSHQGSIEQLVIKDDPRAGEEQCEDDEPYVRQTRTQWHWFTQRTTKHQWFNQTLVLNTCLHSFNLYLTHDKQLYYIINK